MVKFSFANWVYILWFFKSVYFLKRKITQLLLYLFISFSLYIFLPMISISFSRSLSIYFSLSFLFSYRSFIFAIAKLSFLISLLQFLYECCRLVHGFFLYFLSVSLSTSFFLLLSISLSLSLFYALAKSNGNLIEKSPILLTQFFQYCDSNIELFSIAPHLVVALPTLR